MKHKWSILCKKSVTDGETNIMSLLELIEGITIEANSDKPDFDFKKETFVLPLEFELVSYITGLNSEISNIFFKVELFNDSKDKIGEIENKVEIPKNKKNIRNRTMFRQMNIKGDGMYNFKLSIKKSKDDKYKKVEDIPFKVEFSDK